MKNFHLVLLVLIVTVLVAPACNKPSVIGGDLLQQDQLDVLFTDSISIVAKTINADSLKTFDINSQLDSYLCGDLDDPIFGGVKATNYVQARLSIFNPQFQEDDKVDSVILALTYDTTAMYGNFTEEHTINVHRLMEELSSSELYYSDDAFMFDPTPLGTRTFNPNPFTLTPAISYYDNEARFDTLATTLRIPLNNVFGEEILALDSAFLSTDSLFLSQVNGFYLETAGADKSSMLSFALRNINTRISIYYTREDTIPMQYDLLPFSTSGVKTVNFDHYGAASSQVNPFVGDTAKGDSLLFIQGMAGTNISFKFPNLEAFKNSIINKAELILTIAELPGDEPAFDPPTQFLLSEDDDGSLILVEDVVRAFNVGNISVFGGNLIEEEDPALKTYKLNLSAVLQNMALGEVSDEVIMTIFSSSQRANRCVIYGPNHSTHPAKLNLTYTNR